MFRPREYQQAALDAIAERYAADVYRQLLVLPTGAGKTVVFSLLANRWMLYGSRVLVLAHRDRLIQQAVEKLCKIVPVQSMGVVKAEQNRFHAPCVVASVQTLAREARLRQMPQFDLVIIDECHRSAAKQYRNIVKHVCHERTLLLGVTATPDRSDGVGLVPRIFDEVVYELPILELIEQGHLVDIQVKNVGVPMDLADVKTKRGTDGERDLDQDALAIKMDAANWYEYVRDAWLEHARDRRTIVFVPRVAMAYRLAEVMRESGIKAEALDGSTHLGHQRLVVAEFEAGRTQMLINCDLFVEGADIPSIDCVVLARPTKSRIVKMQAIGRGTRPSPATGKSDLLVLDLVAAVQPGLCSAGDALGVKLLKEGENLTQAKKREKKEQEEAERREAEQQELLREQMQARHVDLFGNPSNSASNSRYQFNWDIHREAQQAFLTVAGTIFEISKSGQVYCAYEGTAPIDEFPSYLEARNACEDRAKQILFAPTARWRSKPASSKQLEILHRLKIPYSPEISSGEASNLIDQRFKKFRKAA
jgi:superfamily II DNA or RNA helicase